MQSERLKQHLYFLLALLVFASMLILPVYAQDTCYAGDVGADPPLIGDFNLPLGENNQALNNRNIRLLIQGEQFVLRIRQADNALANWDGSQWVAVSDTSIRGNCVEFVDQVPPPSSGEEANTEGNQDESTTASTNVDVSEGANDGTFGLPEQEQFNPNAYLRVAHLAGDVDPVDVYVDGERKLFENLAYESAGIWSTLPPGNHQVTIVPAGENPDSGMLQSGFQLNAQSWSTLAIVRVPNSDELVLRVIDENQNKPLNSTAKTVVVNALPIGTTVNVARDTRLFYQGFAPIGFDDQIQSYNVVDMDSGVYTFEIIDASSDTVIATREETVLTDSKSYIIAAAGTPDNPQIVLIENGREQALVAQGEMAAPGSVVEALGTSQFLGPFAEAVEVAGLTEMLQTGGPFTILAPPDHIMNPILDANRDDPAQLAAILEAHILPVDLKAYDLYRAGDVTSLAGGTVTMSPSGSANGVPFIDVNIPAANGTIYIINGTLN